MRRNDYTGQRFGRLTAIEFVEVRDRSTYWRYRCDCGAETVQIGLNVKRGIAKSCGCLRAEVLARPKTHGHRMKLGSTRTVRSYYAAKSRCFNPRNIGFDRYGGRGIGMCQRWRDDFSAFLADMGECPADHTIERRDINGDYEPDNCFWATGAVQARNTSRNVVVEANGERMVLKDFARQFGVGYSRLAAGLREGQDLAVLMHRRGIQGDFRVSPASCRSGHS